MPNRGVQHAVVCNQILLATPPPNSVTGQSARYPRRKIPPCRQFTLASDSISSGSHADLTNAQHPSPQPFNVLCDGLGELQRCSHHGWQLGTYTLPLCAYSVIRVAIESRGGGCPGGFSPGPGQRRPPIFSSRPVVPHHPGHQPLQPGVAAVNSRLTTSSKHYPAYQVQQTDTSSVSGPITLIAQHTFARYLRTGHL